MRNFFVSSLSLTTDYDKAKKGLDSNVKLESLK